MYNRETDSKLKYDCCLLLMLFIRYICHMKSSFAAKKKLALATTTRYTGIKKFYGCTKIKLCSQKEACAYYSPCYMFMALYYKYILLEVVIWPIKSVECKFYSQRSIELNGIVCLISNQ